MDIIAIVLLVIFNTQLAKKKNHSAGLWAFLTVVGYLVVGTMLTFVYLILTFKGKFEMEEVRQYVLQVQSDPLKALLITLFGVGGGLLIRFILEKTPPNGPPPVRKP